MHAEMVSHAGERGHQRIVIDKGIWNLGDGQAN